MRLFPVLRRDKAERYRPDHSIGEPRVDEGSGQFAADPGENAASELAADPTGQSPPSRV